MKPAAWVRNLTDPQPHCVTDLKYMSAADTDAGVQYVPLYTVEQMKDVAQKLADCALLDDPTPAPFLWFLRKEKK